MCYFTVKYEINYELIMEQLNLLLIWSNNVWKNLQKKKKKELNNRISIQDNANASASIWKNHKKIESRNQGSEVKFMEENFTKNRHSK